MAKAPPFSVINAEPRWLLAKFNLLQDLGKPTLVAPLWAPLSEACSGIKLEVDVARMWQQR
jgi:hypothetical protein